MIETIKNLTKRDIIIGIIFLILGIPASMYASHLYSKDKKPVYAVKKEPSIIFDKDNSSSSIKLLFKDSIIVDKNVYVTNLVIWDDGGKGIDKEDIRKPFKISVSDSSKFLDYKIIKQRSEAANFRLIPRGKDLLIEWDYFDGNYAFEVQLMYAGNNETSVIVDGEIDSNVMIVREDKTESITSLLFSLFCCIPIFIINNRLDSFIDKKTKSNLLINILLHLIRLTVLILIGFIVLYYVSNYMDAFVI
ncbi:hypothetical protein [Bernardetia sp. MNP-M8]|uniref:hypothetical protein n=1 Tax=Bernardetia sp. MNP-M8 TaxID=3127470 RepID=UPI0030CB0636